MGWLWFFAVVLVIAVLLACPVVLCVRYDKEIDVYVKYLFFKYSFLKQGENSHPKSIKKKAQGKPKKQSETTDEKKKESAFSQLKKENGVSGLIGFLTDMAAIAVGSLSELFTHCNLSRFRIILKLAGEDPASVAKNYGELCAVVMPLAAFILDRFRHEKNVVVSVEPNFLAQKTEIYADLRCRISLFFILRQALSAIIKFVSVRAKNNSQNQKIKNTGGVEHGRTCN